MPATTTIRKEIATQIDQAVSAMLRGIDHDAYREHVGRVKALKAIDQWLVERTHEENETGVDDPHE